MLDVLSRFFAQICFGRQVLVEGQEYFARRDLIGLLDEDDGTHTNFLMEMLQGSPTCEKCNRYVAEEAAFGDGVLCEFHRNRNNRQIGRGGAPA